MRSLLVDTIDREVKEKKFDYENFYSLNFDKELAILHETFPPYLSLDEFINNERAIRLMQEFLYLAGFEHIAIDGIFGKQTSRTMKEAVLRFSLGSVAFEKRKPYQILIAMCSNYLDALSYVPPADRGYAESVVDVALYYAGSGAREIYPNSGPWVRRFMAGCSVEEPAWCAGFVTHCIEQARQPLDEQAADYSDIFLVDDLAELAKGKGTFIAGADINNWWRIVPGAIFLLRGRDSSGVRDYVHTGIVVSVSSKGDRLTLKTVEGNTNESGAREGLFVMERTRGTVSGKIAYGLDFIAI